MLPAQIARGRIKSCQPTICICQPILTLLTFNLVSTLKSHGCSWVSSCLLPKCPGPADLPPLIGPGVWSTVAVMHRLRMHDPQMRGSPVAQLLASRYAALSWSTPALCRCTQPKTNWSQSDSSIFPLSVGTTPSSLGSFTASRYRTRPTKTTRTILA